LHQFDSAIVLIHGTHLHGQPRFHSIHQFIHSWGFFPASCTEGGSVYAQKSIVRLIILPQAKTTDTHMINPMAQSPSFLHLASWHKNINHSPCSCWYSKYIFKGRFPVWHLFVNNIKGSFIQEWVNLYSFYKHLAVTSLSYM